MFLNIISCVGITMIITQSSLFERLRDWVFVRSKTLGELINCPMCLGVWVGLIMSFVFCCNIIHLSFATSIVSWIINIAGNLLINMSYYYDENIGE
tara:strand:+ start:2070 stop:2357 length:288 start_codon:yes stop_codon:yes gene_type:complete